MEYHLKDLKIFHGSVDREVRGNNKAYYPLKISKSSSEKILQKMKHKIKYIPSVSSSNKMKYKDDVNLLSPHQKMNYPTQRE